MSDLQEILDYLSQLPPRWAYGILFAGALLEYIVPPFPGDTVVLAGSALVSAFGWSLWMVYGALTAGSVVGTVVDYLFGYWLTASGRTERLGPRSRKAVGYLVDRFNRHGSVYLAINRFTPGIRALFFVAAGMSELPLGWVVFWSLLSAAVWNGLLVGAGWVLGANIEALESMVRTYNTVAWVAVGLVILYLGVRIWLLIRRNSEGAE